MACVKLQAPFFKLTHLSRSYKQLANSEASNFLKKDGTKVRLQ